MTTMKAYLAMTTAERRADGAKRAAKTRARHKTTDIYAAKFGRVYGVQDDKLLRQMEAALKSGVDLPALVKRKREHEEQLAEYDRKQAKFLVTPITAKTEQHYTDMIKNRRLYE